MGQSIKEQSEMLSKKFRLSVTYMLPSEEQPHGKHPPWGVMEAHRPGRATSPTLCHKRRGLKQHREGVCVWGCNSQSNWGALKMLRPMRHPRPIMSELLSESSQVILRYIQNGHHSCGSTYVPSLNDVLQFIENPHDPLAPGPSFLSRCQGRIQL